MVYDVNILGARLGKLREYISDLQELLPDGLSAYTADRHRRYAVERLLQLIIECTLDILDHVLCAQHEAVSDNYEEILWNAREKSIISPMLYEWLRGLGEVRETLGHDYLTKYDEEVYRSAAGLAKIGFKMQRELWVLAEG